jgi:hypothetical protein
MVTAGDFLVGQPRPLGAEDKRRRPNRQPFDEQWGDRFGRQGGIAVVAAGPRGSRGHDQAIGEGGRQVGRDASGVED